MRKKKKLALVGFSIALSVLLYQQATAFRPKPITLNTAGVLKVHVSIRRHRVDEHGVKTEEQDIATEDKAKIDALLQTMASGMSVEPHKCAPIGTLTMHYGTQVRAFDLRNGHGDDSFEIDYYRIDKAPFLKALLDIGIKRKHLVD